MPEEELLQATTPRTTAKLRRTCSNGYQDPQFDALNDSVVGFSTTIQLRVTEMTQEMKSIEERGRHAAEAMVSAFQRRTSLRSAERKSAEQVEIEKLRHELELTTAQRDAAHHQLLRAADFCSQVREQAVAHQEQMKGEAHALCQHVAKERHELLSSCNRKAEETVNVLRSQLEAEKANVEASVKRHLQTERQKMLRDIQAQQEVSLGQMRTEFDKAQQEIERLRARADAVARERDTSMQQLAAERVRTTQMQTHGSQLLFEKDALTAQFLDLARHAALNGACNDIRWTGDQEPEGFSQFVEQVVSSTEGDSIPPFANRQPSAPPGIFDVVEAAAVEVPAPQTPENRPTYSTISPMFGQIFEKMMGERTGASEGRGGVESVPEGADGTPFSRSGRSDRNPRMVRGSGSTRTPGRGGDGGDDDDDDDGNGFPIGGGNRDYVPFDGWNSENDAWMRSRKQLSIAAAPGAPGGDDDPGRNPMGFLDKFDIFSASLKKNAKDILPNAIRDQTPPRRPGRGFGGGGGGGPGDPNDPYGGSPGSRDPNFNNGTPPNTPPRVPRRDGGGGGGGGGDDGDDHGGGHDPDRPHPAWHGYNPEMRINRDRLKLPKLEVAEQYFAISPATIQQLILNWVRDATKRIGTWHPDATGWFEHTVREAKKLHLEYVTSSASEQCAIEKKYVLGRAAPIPRAENAVDSIARCEILDVIPEWLKKQVNIAGMHSTKYIMWFVLKVLQPSPDYLRIGISKDLLIKPQEIRSYPRAIEWLEIFYQKLEVAVDLKVRIEAQEVLYHLVQTIKEVCYNDMKTTLIWAKLTEDEYTMSSDFSLRDVMELTRSFTVELKLIVRRQRQTAAVHHTLRSFEPQVAAIEDEVPEEGDEDDPTACGMGNAPKKGGTKKTAPPRTSKVCAAYNSDKGCPDGGNCHM
eukprot:6492027-Amphidinium_carterae.1